jgi:L-rhamnonate dehydratase
MKITEIRAVAVDLPPPNAVTAPRRPSWWENDEVANPMSRYPQVKRHRDIWTPKWDPVFCRVTLEDGTWGLGNAPHGRAVAAVIDDHLAPQLVGQNIHATEKLADMMFRLTKPYGSTGLASHAISAIDLGIWDARGRLLQQPVYELLGGAQKERIFCYATGNDVDWYLELGFQAFKLACPYGPADGIDGLRRNEEMVRRHGTKSAIHESSCSIAGWRSTWNTRSSWRSSCVRTA